MKTVRMTAALAIAALSIQILFASTPAYAAENFTEEVLYSFGSTSNDGIFPPAGLITDGSGTFYGITGSGGVYNGGTVFKLTAAGTETVLYSFGASTADGDFPQAGLVMDGAGSLFGTTEAHGAHNHGTVFKITPAGVKTVLHSFGATSTDGATPLSPLIVDSAGNLYGTTATGGDHGDTSLGGTFFKLTPGGLETVLYSFGAAATDGTFPIGGLVVDGGGNIFGITADGGTNNSGTVFEITTAGVEVVLHSFGSQADDGLSPQAGLAIDGAGNLFGTTQFGGAYGHGTVFEVTPAGVETILHSFGATSADGTGPKGSLIIDSDGNLYGTTENGGAGSSGTVFKITPAGVGTVLYSFGATSTDGTQSAASLVKDSAGNLYGTTVFGGTHSDGTIFKLTRTLVVIAPTLSLTASATSVTTGSPVTLNWTVGNDATLCSASGAWSGTQSFANGTFNTTETVAAGDNTYTLTCTNSAGVASESVTVTGNAPDTITPSLSLNASASTVAAGAPVTLTWTVSNGATSCTASGAWSGAQLFADGVHSTSVLPVIGLSTYTLACSNSAGTSTQSVAVTGIGTPTVSLTTTTPSVTAGSPGALTWNVGNSASSCTASGAWSGALPFADGTYSASVIPAVGTNTYTLVCTSSAGSSSASVTITVIPTSTGGSTGGGGGSSSPTLLLGLMMLGLARRQLKAHPRSLWG